MEECVQLGLTKSIGLSNFNPEQLQRILNHCRIKPAVNEVNFILVVLVGSCYFKSLSCSLL